VSVAPAIGKPLAETGAPDLAPEFRLEATAGLASSAGHRALNVAQLGLHVGLERASD